MVLKSWPVPEEVEPILERISKLITAPDIQWEKVEGEDLDSERLSKDSADKLEVLIKSANEHPKIVSTSDASPS